MASVERIKHVVEYSLVRFVLIQTTNIVGVDHRTAIKLSGRLNESISGLFTVVHPHSLVGRVKRIDVLEVGETSAAPTIAMNTLPVRHVHAKVVVLVRPDGLTKLQLLCWLGCKLCNLFCGGHDQLAGALTKSAGNLTGNNLT